MHSRELAEQQRHEPASRAGRGPDREPTAQLRFRLGLEIGEQLLLGGEHALGTPIEPPTRFGGLDPPARAVEQLPAEALLQATHLLADRRLRHTEPLGGL